MGRLITLLNLKKVLILAVMLSGSAANADFCSDSNPGVCGGWDTQTTATFNGPGGTDPTGEGRCLCGQSGDYQCCNERVAEQCGGTDSGYACYCQLTVSKCSAQGKNFDAQNCICTTPSPTATPAATPVPPAAPSSCANWNGTSWISMPRTLTERSCGGQTASDGLPWANPSYLDPWRLCNQCNGSSMCATACIADGDGSTGICTCPNYGSSDFLAMTTANQNICCAAPSGATPTPTPVVSGTTTPAPTITPSPSPTPGCFSYGGSGRLCGSSADCCTGYTCEVVGNQPFKLSPDAVSGGADGKTVGVSWITDYRSDNADALLTTTVPTAPLSTVFTGPTRMCVDSTHGGNGSVPAMFVNAPLMNTSHANYPVKVTLPAGSSVDERIVNVDSAGYTVCELQWNDTHRVKSGGVPAGCACQTGYEPAAVSADELSRVAFNVHLGNSTLDQLWANVLLKMDHKPDLVAPVEKFYSKFVPEAKAYCYPNCPGSSCGSDPSFTGTMPSMTANGPCCGLTVGSSAMQSCYCNYYPNASNWMTACTIATPTPTPAVPGGTVTFTPNTYGFGTVTVNSASAVKSVVLTNTTSTSFTNCTIYLDDNTNFILTNAGVCKNISAGGNCTIGIQANPASVGSFSTGIEVSCGNGGVCSTGKQIDALFAGLKNTGKKKLTEIGDLLVGTAGACTPPTCAYTSYCDCNADGWNNPACPYQFMTQADCFCQVGYQTATYCPASPTPTSGVGVCTVSGAFTVTGSAAVTTPTPSPTPTGGATPIPTVTVTPNPSIVPTPTVQPLYIDSGTSWVTTPNLWNSHTGYGNFSGQTSPSRPLVGCVKTCPNDTSGNPVPRSTSDATQCDCSGNGSGLTNFDPSTWTCISCPTNSIVTNGQCKCPFGWEVYGGACRPKMPSAEYIHSTASPINYPVCSSGSGNQNQRIPTSYSGFPLSNAASSSFPTTNDSTTIGTGAQAKTYIYSDGATNPADGSQYPFYAYADLNHCACSGRSIANPNISSPPTKTPNQFSPDTFDAISSFDSTGLPNKPYGMIAMTVNGTVDPRAGSSILSGDSKCACPNLNEVPVFTGGVMTCQPVIPQSDLNRVFTTFNPVADDSSTSPTQVYTRANVNVAGGISGGYVEPLTGANLVKTVQVTSAPSAPNVLANYTRHIWKCQIGYSLDMSQSPPKCVMDESKQKCDATSPINSTTSTAADFAAVINKKLACCMNNKNSATISSADVKFDCVDNNYQNTANDFNALWKSTDDEADGGEMAAIILASGNGKPLTGFYTLTGARCSEYSEFDPAGIQPGKINPGAANTSSQQNSANGATGDGQFEASGSRILPPSGTGFTSLQSGFSAAGKSMVAPQPSAGNVTENAKARRCPILVRAAVVASCPPVSKAVNAVHNTVIDSRTHARCPAADNIQVHIRAEQVFEIAGSPKMQPVDTVVDRKSASAVSMEQIIRKKNGSVCLPGMTSGNGGCHY